MGHDIQPDALPPPRVLCQDAVADFAVRPRIDQPPRDARAQRHDLLQVAVGAGGTTSTTTAPSPRRRINLLYTAYLYRLTLVYGLLTQIRSQTPVIFRQVYISHRTLNDPK